MHKVFIILGSNIDPWNNVNETLKLLKIEKKLDVERISRFYETLPTHDYGANFINVAVKLWTSLDITELKKLFRIIERVKGRIRTEDRNEARTIDIDIIFYDDLIDGQIPDPEFLKYAHVAIPIIELEPSFKHPVTEKQISHYKSKFQQEIGKTIFLLKELI
jgi:2-amino-4-hydroxy-6-hydroxymethyldihydropteridine diphosphokinase